MSIKGTQVVVSGVTEERLEQIHASLSDNFAFVSIDVSFDADAQVATFLLGVELADQLDSDDLVNGIIDDAFEGAIRGTDSPAVASKELVSF